jgi:hypothetical protein
VNGDLRLYARGKDVPLWAVAKMLRVGDATLYRWLNINQTDDFKKIFKSMVDIIARDG